MLVMVPVSGLNLQSMYWSKTDGISDDNKPATITTQSATNDPSYVFFGAQCYPAQIRRELYFTLCCRTKLTSKSVESEKRELIEEIERLQQRATRGTRE